MKENGTTFDRITGRGVGIKLFQRAPIPIIASRAFRGLEGRPGGHARSAPRTREGSRVCSNERRNLHERLMIRQVAREGRGGTRWNGGGGGGRRRQRRVDAEGGSGAESWRGLRERPRERERRRATRSRDTAGVCVPVVANAPGHRYSSAAATLPLILSHPPRRARPSCGPRAGYRTHAPHRRLGAFVHPPAYTISPQERNVACLFPSFGVLFASDTYCRTQLLRLRSSARACTLTSRPPERSAAE